MPSKPRGKPFEKGKSGNPGGRPRELKHVRDLARLHTKEAVATLVKIMHNESARRDQPGREQQKPFSTELEDEQPRRWNQLEPMVGLFS